MSFWWDYSQDKRIDKLREELRSENNSVDRSLSRIWDEIHLERRRNDVQAGRIKVLAESLEAVLKGLATSSPLAPSAAKTLLARLDEAMKPVNLKESPPEE